MQLLATYRYVALKSIMRAAQQRRSWRCNAPVEIADALRSLTGIAGRSDEGSMRRHGRVAHFCAAQFDSRIEAASLYLRPLRAVCDRLIAEQQ
jgi:hypothetical protein